MPRDFPQPSADPLALYPYRFRDPVSGRWVRARYKAARAEIVMRYAKWEKSEPSDTRWYAGRPYNPWRPGQT
jgi:hypothetical protein